jgi:hypothetical protein
MSDRVALDCWLRRAGNRLNLIIAASKALQYLFRFGVWSGMAGLALLFLGRPAAGFAVWLGFAAAGAAFGVVRARRQRLDDMAAAAWLDQRLQTGEIIAAARFCLERGCSGVFDERILRSALERIGAEPRIRWPFQMLKRQLMKAGGLILTGVLVLAFWNPLSRLQPVPGRLSVPDRNPAESGPSAEASLPVQSWRQLAQELFPTDPRLARQAEQALQNGDMDALRRFLTQSLRNLDQRLSGATNPEERRTLREERRKIDQLAQTLQDQNRKGKTGAADDTKNSAEDEQPAGNDELPAANGAERRDDDSRGQPGRAPQASPQPRPGKGPADQGQRRNGESDASEADEGQGTSNRKKAASGSGRADKRRDRGSLEEQPTKGPTVSKEPKDQRFFEYLLSGKDPETPLSEIVAGSKRAGEETLARRKIPRGYQNVIESYFLKLVEKSKQIDKEKKR